MKHIMDMETFILESEIDVMEVSEDEILEASILGFDNIVDPLMEVITSKDASDMRGKGRRDRSFIRYFDSIPKAMMSTLGLPILVIKRLYKNRLKANRIKKMVEEAPDDDKVKLQAELKTLSRHEVKLLARLRKAEIEALKRVKKEDDPELKKQLEDARKKAKTALAKLRRKRI